MRQEFHFSGNAILGDRARQEDRSIFQFPDPARDDAILLILADGMGGHAGGAEAAEAAVRIFADTFAGTDPRLDRLSIALQAANREVGILRHNSGMGDMGCTLVGAHINGHQIDWVSVGDSLLYLCRQGQMARLNADHSFAPILAEAVRRGEMSEAAAAHHPDRNALRSAVSGEALTLVDRSASPLPLQTGDIILVASDGLATLSEPEIASVMSRPGATAAAIVDDLLEAVTARRKPRQDNTTVMIVAPDAGRKPALPRLAAPPAPGAGSPRAGLSRAGRFLLSMVVAFVLTLALILAASLGLRHVGNPQPTPEPAPTPTPAPKLDEASGPPAGDAQPAPAAPSQPTPQKPAPAPSGEASKPAENAGKQDGGKLETNDKRATEPAPKPKPTPGSTPTRSTSRGNKPEGAKPAAPAATSPPTSPGAGTDTPANQPVTAPAAEPAAPTASPDPPPAASPPADNRDPAAPEGGGAP